jgi:excisionase family DNA binding protein
MGSPLSNSISELLSDSWLTEPPLVTIREAGALVGVSRRTVNNWIAKGLVDVVYTAGGGVRIVYCA